MMSDSCSNAMLRRCIFSQMENGLFSRPLTSTVSSPALRQRRASSLRTSSMMSAPWPRRKFSRAWMVSDASFSNWAKARFCSSVFTASMPMRSAKGA